MNLFELSAVLSLNSKGFESGLQNSESLMGKIGGSIKNGFSKLGNVAHAAMAKAGDAALGLVKDSINAGANFDAGMSKVAAISGATGKDLDKLRQKAMDMGAKTKFSASEAADAFSYMAMAGWKTSDMLSGIEGIMALAAASGEDLATTSDIVTDALTAFGLKASDSAHFADIMAAASSNANTNVSLMGETFKYVAPVAGALGISAEDTAEAIGLLANAGIKGSQAGTSLRSILTRLATDAGASSKELGALGTLTEELGVQFYKSDGSVRDFSDIIDDARKAWKKLSKEDAATFAKKIAGQEGISAWLAMMEAAPEDLEKLRKSIEDCDGAANKMADTMEDNLKGDTTKFMSALESLQIVISDKLSPTLRKFVQFGSDKLAVLKKAFLDGGFKKAVSVFGDILSEIWGKFKDYLPKLASAGWDLVKWAVKGVFNGIKKVKLPTWKDVKKFAVDAWNTIKKGVADLGGIIFGKNKKGKVKWPTWKDVKDAALDAWNKIKDSAKNLGKEFGALVFGTTEKGDVKWPTWDGENGLKAQAEEKLKSITQGISDYVSNAANWTKVNLAALLGITDENGAEIKDPKGISWSAIGRKIVDKIRQNVIDATSSVQVKLTRLLGIMSGNDELADNDAAASWSAIKEAIINKIKDASSIAKIKIIDLLGLSKAGVSEESGWDDIASGILDAITKKAGEAGEFLKRLILGSNYEEGKSTWEDAGQKIFDWVTSAFVGKDLLGSIIEGKGDRKAKLLSFVGDIVHSISEFISKPQNARTISEMIVNTVKSLASNAGKIIAAVTPIISDVIKAAVPVVIETIKTPEIWAQLWDLLKTIITSAYELIKELMKVGAGEAIKGANDAFDSAVEGAKDAVDTAKTAGADAIDSVFGTDLGEKTRQAIQNRKFREWLYSDAGIDWMNSQARTQESKQKAQETVVQLSKEYEEYLKNLSPMQIPMEPDEFVKSRIQDMLNSQTFTFSVTPQLTGDYSLFPHAKGAWDIPYDNYPAMLHRGEMVLTSSQARRYRDGDGGSMNLSALTMAVVNAVREGMAGAVVRSYLNGKDVTDDVARRMGNAMKSQRYAT